MLAVNPFGGLNPKKVSFDCRFLFSHSQNLKHRTLNGKSCYPCSPSPQCAAFKRRLNRAQVPIDAANQVKIRGFCYFCIMYTRSKGGSNLFICRLHVAYVVSDQSRHNSKSCKRPT